MDLVDLQAIAATGWGFQERAYLGGWQLRAAGGRPTRANCAWPLADSGLPLRETLDAVRTWYGERGYTPRIQTIIDSPLDGDLAAAGFEETSPPVLRQAAPLEPAVRMLAAAADSRRRSEITADLPEGYFTAYRRGLTIPQFGAVLSTGDALIRFAVVRDEAGLPLSVGRLAIDSSTGYAGIAALATVESARRRGLARVIVRDLLSFALEQGADHTYLEMDEDNVPARALYEELGYTTVHRCHCRTPIV